MLKKIIAGLSHLFGVPKKDYPHVSPFDGTRVTCAQVQEDLRHLADAYDARHLETHVMRGRLLVEAGQLIHVLQDTGLELELVTEPLLHSGYQTEVWFSVKDDENLLVFVRPEAREIELWVRGTERRVTFSTREGRHAVRNAVHAFLFANEIASAGN